jgi:hypothetical protein
MGAWLGAWRRRWWMERPAAAVPGFEAVVIDLDGAGLETWILVWVSEWCCGWVHGWQPGPEER